MNRFIPSFKSEKHKKLWQTQIKSSFFGQFCCDCGMFWGSSFCWLKCSNVLWLLEVSIICFWCFFPIFLVFPFSFLWTFGIGLSFLGLSLLNDGRRTSYKSAQWILQIVHLENWVVLNWKYDNLICWRLVELGCSLYRFF